MLENVRFTPENGFRDTSAYPTYPANEAEARDQLQRGLDQLRDGINVTIDKLNSTEDGSSGADNVSATPISDLDGSTVQELLESIRNKLKSITDGSSGADFIGATGISGLTGNTIQSILESLKIHVDTYNTNHKASTSTDHDNRYFTETELKATDGISGSNLIGTPAIVGLTGTTVKEQLASLYNVIVQVVLGQIPDNSLTDVKLSDAADQIKARFASHIAEDTQSAHKAKNITLENGETVEDAISAANYSTPQEATASIISLPSTVVEGQFSDITIMGRSLKQELDYNRDTWAEWAKSAGVVGNSSGLEFTFSGTQFINAKLSTNLKGNTKYGLLFNIVSNTLSTKRLAISGVLTGSSFVAISPSETGNKKIIFTTQTTIATNELNFFQEVMGDDGLKVKIKDIRVFELPIGSEIESDFTNMTADQLAQKYPYIQGGGVVSTEFVRVKSFGKNLIRNGNAEEGVNGWALGIGGSVTVENGKFKVSTTNSAKAIYQTIKVKPNTDYYINAITEDGTITEELIRVYEKGSLTSVIKSGNGTFNTGNRTELDVACYLNSVGYAYFSNIQLEEGTVATEYEPYKGGGEAYIDGELRSLPNGVYDEFNVNTGELAKKVSDNVSISGTTYASVDKTTYTNVDVVKTTSFSSAVAGTTAKDGMTRYYDKNGVELTEVAQTDIDNAASVGKYYWHTDKTLWIIVAKGAYADIVAARTGLATSTLNYQLAAPVATQYPPQSLVAYPNGHLIIEPGVVRFYAKPDANGVITRPDITNTDKDIYSVESVKPVIDGAVEENIAPTSFNATTITNAAYDDTITYEVIYYCDPAKSTLGTTEYSYPMNLKAVVEGNAKAVGEMSESLNDLWLYVIGGI